MTNMKNILGIILLTVVLFFRGEFVECEEIPQGTIGEIVEQQKGKLSVTPVPTKAAYTFEKVEQVMYATSNVNVRTLPSTEGEKLGMVFKGEELWVIAKCNETPWYRVRYEETIAYVHRNYFSKEKPVMPTPTPTPAVRFANSFFVTDDGTTYVLDAYGAKIVKEENGSCTDIFLSRSVQPVDMLHVQDEFYVYDEIKKEFQVYRENGEFLFALVPELKQYDEVRRIEEIQGKIALVTYYGERFLLDRESQTFVQAETAVRPQPEDGYDYAEIVGYDAEGNVYTANTRLLNNICLLAGEITIFARTPDGEFLGAATLPTKECNYLPDRYLWISPGGRVYTMLGLEKDYRIEELTLTAQPESNWKEIEKTATELQKKYINNSAERLQNGYTPVKEITLSRQEIYDRAVTIAEYEWTLTPKNVKESRIREATLPRYIAALVKEQEGRKSWEVKMTGVPYCWGGFISLRRNAWNHFDTQIYKNDYLAGNINSDGYYVEYTAGLDCSGYASVAFGMGSKFSTGMLSDIGTRIYDRSLLQTMDMFVAPGDHVILFCGWIDEGTMLVAEASMRAGKVVIHPKSLNSLVVPGTYQMSSPW